ncbi:MAG: YabP/YqfC family sporulation protein [Bacilli bacterium]|nr:YabP/YqfC family sporulation protein [Bacilli bacterium]
MNYKNVIDLSNSFIKIELFDSYLLIKGDNLNIKKLDNRELLITGKIKGIDFNDE